MFLGWVMAEAGGSVARPNDGIGRTAGAVLVIVVLSIAPWQLGGRVGPTAGLLAALAAFPAWWLVAPRPRSPLSFVVHVWGWVFIAGGFLACAIRSAARAVG